MNGPWYPIVYVRGYAPTRGAIEATTADPFDGFNEGSTVLRQRGTGKIEEFVFESPIVRLRDDHDYRDVYEEGREVEDGDISPRSIWVYRYYRSASKLLGDGRREDIETLADGLAEYLREIRQKYVDCGHSARSFKVCIVAHSMGGLVTRCYLQNPARWLDPERTHGVDKVFTYGTPHGGIELRGIGIGNVPPMSARSIENFNRKTMAEYLDVEGPDDVRSLAGRFPAERFFCLVGTNHRDYGAPRHAVGPMSDGLVLIENATVSGAPRAYVHRSHSGFYGLVNSEDGYQNLRRFLFGDYRIDGFLLPGDVPLPKKIQGAIDEGKTVQAAYHVECVARVRGARWDLHRRLVDEGSSRYASFERMHANPARPMHMFSQYLADSGRVNRRRAGLGFSLDLAVQVPAYEISRKWRRDAHFEGGYLYREKHNFVLTERAGVLYLKHGVDSRTPNEAKRRVTLERVGEQLWKADIPIRGGGNGFTGSLVLRAQPWNHYNNPDSPTGGT